MIHASGLDANLTATFAPNPVPAGTTTSQATIRCLVYPEPGDQNVTRWAP
jgi:hypothetical protein